MAIISQSFVHPREEIVDTIERIYRYRMTTTSGGNLSVHDENGDVWITPARVDKGSLRSADIVCVRCGGKIDGAHKPSSEYPFHQAIYRARPDLRAVVHAHPVALVAFSIVRQLPNTAIFPEAHRQCYRIGFAPYALPGSQRLGENIAEVFRGGAECVMLENHGVAVGGEDLASAFQRFETLEFCAKTSIKASHLGSIRYLTEQQLALTEKPLRVSETFQPRPPTTAEKEMRQLVAAFVQRGYRQRLLISTQGSFSARIDDGDGEAAFVITSYGIDRSKASPENLCLVRGDRHEAGSRPSRAAAIHRAIYRKHPSIRAIVNAMPVNATAFAITAAPLDARTIPESYLFLRDVGTVPFEVQFGDPRGVAEMISPDQPVMLLENNGVLVAGTSVLDAFDRLEVLESTAEALINAQRLGTLCPMNDAAIDELVEAFLGKKR
jgi:L-fuculose-phosphate aldolase